MLNTAASFLHFGGFYMEMELSSISSMTPAGSNIGTIAEAVNAVKCSWWWAKTLSETCRAEWE